MTELLGFGIGGWEWLVIAGLGLLIFGSRLPEVGKSLGRGIVEFRKGLKSVEEDIDSAGKEPPRDDPKQFKFDPHTGKPLEHKPNG